MIFPVYRHVRSGGVYAMIARAINESDLTDVVVYRSLSTGTTWVRSADEFFDGRFEKVSACTGLTWDPAEAPQPPKS